MLSLLICYLKARVIKLFQSKVDKEIFDLLLRVFPSHSVKLIEVGGLMRGRLLSDLKRCGYSVTLCNILDEQIENTKIGIELKKLKADFVIGDLTHIEGRWNGLWNSGVIQCYPSKARDKLIQKIATLASTVLLIYPDVGHPDFPSRLSIQASLEPQDCAENGGMDLSVTLNKFFKEVHSGFLLNKNSALPYSIHYVWAKNPRDLTS
jgi:hypothetical protein